jgi:tetratricopeptide (TPR) repeat protein
MKNTGLLFSSIVVAALASPAAAQTLAVPSVPAIPAFPAIPPFPAFPAIAALPAIPVVGPLPSPHSMRLLVSPWTASSRDSDDRADDLYDQARDLIEEGKFDRAVSALDRLIGLKSSRTDAAIYWKAYSLAKLGQRADALAALADLYKQFADSRWLRDAKALEVEVRQASGQAVSPASQGDEELKLMALRGIMQSDPEQALPIIEKMLTGTNSPKVKDRALFVLSQSPSARAKEIIAGVAKGNANPDLQLRAIRYIGIMGGTDNRQILADVYKSTNDTAVKRSILRSFMTANDRERLFAAAKTETDASLRAEAIRQLGVIHASSELAQLYQSEASLEQKKAILQSMFVGGDSDKLIDLAKNEKDPELRKTAIRNLGLMKRTGTTEVLTGIYASDPSVEVKKAVINALFLQSNATGLVGLARAEKNVELKKDIVSKLSNMKSKEATDYLMELLK